MRRDGPEPGYWSLMAGIAATLAAIDE